MAYPPKLTAQAREALWKKPPQERIKEIGHRGYVGGTGSDSWYGIGLLQYQFLVSRSLKHDHKFLDVACGSLRLGQYLIPYLDPGNYAGLEGEAALVEAGLKHELLFNLAKQKKPRFAFNYDFDVSSLGKFDYAIAQSLFTHLTLDDIEKCFAGLAGQANPKAVFFATYFEGDPATNRKGPSHAQFGWHYNASDIAQRGEKSGWKIKRIGEWGHPRKQLMLRCDFAG